jgi:uncharacterized membrane protein
MTTTETFIASVFYFFGWVGFCLSKQEDESLWSVMGAGLSWPLIAFLAVGEWAGKQRLSPPFTDDDQ